MAQLKIPVDNFTLRSKFTCFTTQVYKYPYPNSYEGTPTHTGTDYGIHSAASLITKTVTFSLDVPQGAVITGAKVYATLGSAPYGASTCTINGETVSHNNTVCVDVAIADGASSVDVAFRYKCVEHSTEHSVSGFADRLSQSGQYEYRTYYFEHSSNLEYTDVYLLVDYKPALEFGGWTDDPLVVGETFVKAVHMTEIQQWAAVLSEYADNGTPTFTEAVPGETSLALWLSQVQEIRAVLDVVSPNHEAWIDVSVNCPRADVMTQLREIIVAAM